nr:Glutathione peroxidase [Ipomoea batatas]GMD98174.1 Glutathione peroxidase [Ipomoea batatas]GMD99078.1 Glutathione peroxidase [Ipomoea batatas]GMD99890.1 Glutathione peroxidase [Ipomoea batatas]
MASDLTKSVYDFIVKDAKGNDVHLNIYKGKVLLIVNVASKWYVCLEILAFPCNQFGEEEPGSNDQILDFVCTRFKSEFPVFGKVKQNNKLDCDLRVVSKKYFLPQIEVNGENASPLYKYMKLGKWGIFGDDIQWNFAKFLVDQKGQLVDRYYPTTSPLTIERDIQKLLGRNI